MIPGGNIQGMQLYNLQQPSAGAGAYAAATQMPFMQQQNTMQNMNNTNQAGNQYRVELNFMNINAPTQPQPQPQIATTMNTSISYGNPQMFNMQNFPQSQFVKDPMLNLQMQPQQVLLATPMSMSLQMQHAQQQNQQPQFMQQQYNSTLGATTTIPQVSQTAMAYPGLTTINPYATSNIMNSYGNMIAATQPHQLANQIQLMNQQQVQQQQQLNQQQLQLQQQQQYQMLQKNQQLQSIGQFGNITGTPQNSQGLQNNYSYGNNQAALLLQNPLNQMNFTQQNCNIMDQLNGNQAINQISANNNVMTTIGNQNIQNTQSIQNNQNTQSMLNFGTQMQQMNFNNQNIQIQNLQHDNKQNILNNSIQTKQIVEQTNPQMVYQQNQQQILQQQTQPLQYQQKQLKQQQIQEIKNQPVEVSSEENQYSNQVNTPNNIQLKNQNNTMKNAILKNNNNEVAFNQLLKENRGNPNIMDSPCKQITLLESKRCQEIVIDTDESNYEEMMQRKQNENKKITLQLQQQQQQMMKKDKEYLINELKIKKADLNSQNSNSNSQQFMPAQTNPKNYSGFNPKKQQKQNNSSKYTPTNRFERENSSQSRDSQNLSLLEKSKKISKDKQQSNKTYSNGENHINNGQSNNSQNGSNKLKTPKASEFLEQETLKNQAFKQQWEQAQQYLLRQESSQSSKNIISNAPQNGNAGLSKFNNLSKKDDEEYSDEIRNQKLRQSKRIQDKSKNDDGNNSNNEYQNQSPQIVQSQVNSSSQQNQSQKDVSMNNLVDDKKSKTKKEVTQPLVCKKCNNKCSKGQFLIEKQICRKCEASLTKEKKESMVPAKTTISSNSTNNSNVSNDFWALKLQKKKIEIGSDYQAEIPPYQLHESSFRQLHTPVGLLSRPEHFQVIMNNRIYEGSINSHKYTIIYDKICKQIDKFTFSDMNSLLSRYCYNLDEIIEKLNLKDETLAEIIRQQSNYKSNTRMTRQQMSRKFQY